MKSFIIAILTGLTTAVLYFLLNSFFPEITLGIKAILVALFAATAYFFYSTVASKR
ncbi:hypothetical protein QWY20_11515 [Alkalimonas sp. MEB108]|uniref:Uncharacterized protein n=1 Tax=Alkalimonas cellulosilytica TaxID=3058395 RepID=A0ABU7J6J6_9GAMM|nr:hypothetical protein [Alkalimonas sp. MEB108]MEE2002082.1 hypothetical protein [Alkalimonas sp. MEB108]